MQLSKNQLIKLDFLIERYMDDNTIKEAKVIEDYLKHYPAKMKELLITVYFNLSRFPTEEERKIIDEHKINLFNRLQEKGYIKYEEQRTAVEVEKQYKNENNINLPKITKEAKKQKLNRYRVLTEQLYRLYKLLEELQEKQHMKSHIQTMDYTKVKVTCSRKHYDFTGINLLTKVQDTENKIAILKAEKEKEREYISSVIEQIEDIRIRYIFWYRYLMVEDWKEVSRLAGLKKCTILYEITQ